MAFGFGSSFLRSQASTSDLRSPDSSTRSAPERSTEASPGEIPGEGTRRFADPRLLARERSLADGERSVARPRPLASQLPLPVQARWIERGTVLPARIEQGRVRALFDQFVQVVGPAARSLFELELRTLGRRPSNMSERDFDALVEALAARIPLASARARFLARAADITSGG